MTSISSYIANVISLFISYQSYTDFEKRMTFLIFVY